MSDLSKYILEFLENLTDNKKWNQEIAKQILQNRYRFSKNQVNTLFTIQTNVQCGSISGKTLNIAIFNKPQKRIEEETIREIATKKSWSLFQIIEAIKFSDITEDANKIQRDNQKRAEANRIDYSNKFTLESVKERLDAYDLKTSPNYWTLANIIVMLCIHPAELTTLCITDVGVTGYAKNQRAVHAAMVHRTKNLAHAITIAREALCYNSNNNTLLAQNYVVDGIVKSKKIPNLSNCSECGKDIILHPLKAFTTLSCGHVFYRLCIEKNFYLQFQIHVHFLVVVRRLKLLKWGIEGVLNQVSSVVRRMKKHSIQSRDLPEIIEEEISNINNNKDGEGNCSTNQSIIFLEKKSHKRPSKDAPKNKLSSKKVKTKDRNISMLKKLIDKLKSPSSSTSSTTSQTKSITSPSNFSDLYSAIVKAEERIESVNQKIIICYFAFEKKLKERLAKCKKTNKEHRSQRKLYKEVEKQFSSNLSKNAIEKRIERARKILTFLVV
ncbi:41882_t:CDS:2 [Gigaspora margarita]|uniref:41882_t:CDS:1 n=1 Tax=Gigaspora margarita TaxID=4874 RepID=A0ABN7UY55_GIGMA|nr:41882_t:CDS:2 [Gigaspora margarita]